jgi:hypothetical protein
MAPNLGIYLPMGAIRYARLGGAFAICVSAIALAGWHVPMDSHSGIAAELAMGPASAVALALVGLALCLAQSPRVGSSVSCAERPC